MDAVGNRRFSGAAKAARGQAPQLMIENQVCGDLGDREDRFGKKGIRRWPYGFVCFYLTGRLMGDPIDLPEKVRVYVD